MRKFKLLTITLIFTVFLVGCNMLVGKEEDKIEYESEDILNFDEINLTMINPKTINPIINTNKSVNNILDLVYDGLFTIDENYNVVEQLVESYEIYDSGLSMDIKLKEAKWHNGEELTSQDVSFTVDLIKRNDKSPYFSLIENIKSITIRDNKEFTIRFNLNDAFSKETLIFPIVCKNEFSNTNNISDVRYNLIGSGPYKIADYKDRKSMELEINEDYYGELVNTQKDIFVSMVPDGESQISMVNALKSDIAEISPSDLSKFNEKEFSIVRFEGREFESIIFNYDNELLNDVNFRKAIASVINREQIEEEAYANEAQGINFPINSKSEYYSDDVKAIEYSLDNAKQYLEKVKIPKSFKEQTQEEQIEEFESGGNDPRKVISNINLKIIVNKNSIERVKISHLISSKLSNIGIKSTIIELDDAQMEQALYNKEYDLAMVGWELSSVPDVTSIVAQSGYIDEKLNRSIEELNLLSSKAQIIDKYKEIQEYVNEKIPFISLVIKNEYIVKNRRIEGNIKPNSFNIYNGIEELKI